MNLAISSEGLRTIEELSGDIVKTVTIEDIVYTTVADLNKKRELFAYICKDTRLNRVVGHIFETVKGTARKICLLVATAFEVSKEERNADNPFEASSARSFGGVPQDLEDKLLNRKFLTALKVLGTGQFGQVYLADQTLDFDGHQVCLLSFVVRGLFLI